MPSRNNQSTLYFIDLMEGRKMLNVKLWAFAETSLNQLNRLPKSMPSGTSNEEPFQNATIM